MAECSAPDHSLVDIRKRKIVDAMRAVDGLGHDVAVGDLFAFRPRLLLEERAKTIT
jgi:hypothetical protein